MADHKDAGKWYQELAIELTYSDNEGVAKLSVQKDDGAYTELSTAGSTTQADGKTYQLTFDRLEEGEHTYTFKAADAAGNETVTSALTAKLDMTKPQLDDASFNEGYRNLFHWLIRKDSLEITIPVKEAGSGIDKVNYTLIPETGNAENSGTTGQAAVKKASGGNSADYTAVIYVTPDFKGRIRITATDNAGNASDTKTIGTDGSGINGVIVEDNAPEITFTVNGGEALKEYKEAPAVAVTVKDDGENTVSAGLASVTYRIGNGAENMLEEDFAVSMKTEAGFIIPKEMIPAGGGEILVKATDNAGNQSEKKLIIRIHTGGGTEEKPTEPTEPTKPSETPEPEPTEIPEQPKLSEQPKPSELPKPSESSKPSGRDDLFGQTVKEPSGIPEGQQPEKEDVQTTPTVADTGAALKLGDGTVIVTVVCEEQGYTAEVADTMAAANAVLTPEQMQSVADGETIEIRIDVKDISGNVSEQDKRAIENGIEEYRKKLPGLTLGMYVDISIFIKVGGGDWNAVNQTHEPVDVVIGIPAELQSDDRIFYIIRSHEGDYTLLTDMDEEPDTITIRTDRFSTYAIAYEQASGTGENNKCGLCHICPTFLGICCFVWLAVIVAVFFIICMIIRRNRKEKEEK